MKWQDLLPKGWRHEGSIGVWSALVLYRADFLFIQCAGSPRDDEYCPNKMEQGRLVVGVDRHRSGAIERPFNAVIPEGTPLGQAVREIVTNPEGWPALLDLLLDDPEAGPHVRRLLEETS